MKKRNKTELHAALQEAQRALFATPEGQRVDFLFRELRALAGIETPSEAELAQMQRKAEAQQTRIMREADRLQDKIPGMNAELAEKAIAVLCAYGFTQQESLKITDHRIVHIAARLAQLEQPPIKVVANNVDAVACPDGEHDEFFDLVSR